MNMDVADKVLFRWVGDVLASCKPPGQQARARERAGFGLRVVRCGAALWNRRTGTGLVLASSVCAPTTVCPARGVEDP